MIARQSELASDADSIFLTELMIGIGDLTSDSRRLTEMDRFAAPNVGSFSSRHVVGSESVSPNRICKFHAFNTLMPVSIFLLVRFITIEIRKAWDD